MDLTYEEWKPLNAWYKNLSLDDQAELKYEFNRFRPVDDYEEFLLSKKKEIEGEDDFLR